jgi:hypothetical protein
VTVLRYRGHDVSAEQVAFIGKLIESHPASSRRDLSRRLCKAWGWFQENGSPRDVVCRGLLLALYRAGHIQLPPPRWSGFGRGRRRAPEPIAVPSEPLVAGLDALGALDICQVRRTPEEPLVESLIAQHHYLGYARPVGEHLKYLVTAQGRLLACFVWCSPARRLGPRDRYIGWDAPTRQANIRFIAYQSRLLILPWVRVPHLASHLLGRMSRQLSADWERIYAHPVYLTETFVDSCRYRGTCYRASNWTHLGLTTGRGTNAPTHQPTQSRKDLFVYPLVKDFRARLGVEK